MKKLLGLVAVLFSLSATAEDYSQHKELYMANEAGGDVVLTLEACAFPAATAKGFTNRSYATVAGGKIMEEGCWFAPSTEGAPQSEHVMIIPIVNVWYDGLILPFEQRAFGPQQHTMALKDSI